jgi:hypothetical protein
MRIAQVSPLYESCPPQLYGGTERVVSYLTEELVHQGHDVTLFASGDSGTAATLRAPCEEALRLNGDCKDTLPYHLVMMIGIGGRLAAPPLPHHRAYGSVPRRFDRVKPGEEHRGGEDRGCRNTGCVGPVGRPGVRTCARNRSASRQQPPPGTSADHAVAAL